MSTLFKKLTIGQVAREAGLQASALRYYEHIGLIPAPERINNRRSYKPAAINQIRFIRAVQSTGFSLTEIADLLNDADSKTPYSDRLQELAREKLEAVDALIAQALGVRRVLKKALNCRCTSAEQCALFFNSIPPADQPRTYT